MRAGVLFSTAVFNEMRRVRMFLSCTHSDASNCDETNNVYGPSDDAILSVLCGAALAAGRPGGTGGRTGAARSHRFGGGAGRYRRLGRRRRGARGRGRVSCFVLFGRLSWLELERGGRFAAGGRGLAETGVRAG